MEKIWNGLGILGGGDFLKKRRETRLPATKKWTESLWELINGKDGPRRPLAWSLTLA